jgi:hypothetical protein
VRGGYSGASKAVSDYAMLRARSDRPSALLLQELTKANIPTFRRFTTSQKCPGIAHVAITMDQIHMARIAGDVFHEESTKKRRARFADPNLLTA